MKTVLQELLTLLPSYSHLNRDFYIHIQLEIMVCSLNYLDKDVKGTHS
jgi:hypothetical protein